MSEQRNTHAQSTVDFLERIGGAEVLASPENRKEFIMNLDYPQLRGWIQSINGLVRGIEPEKHSIDGQNVRLPGFIPPEPEDKEMLFGETLEAAQEILRTDDDTIQALDRVSLLFAGTTNFIHLFEDGNGRTSRVVELLIKEGYDGSPESQDKVQKVIGSDGGNFLDNNPSFLMPWLKMWTVSRHKPEEAKKWPVYVRADKAIDSSIGEEGLSHLGDEAKKQAKKIATDDLGYLAATKIMIQRGLLPDGVDFSNNDFAGVESDQYFAKFDDETIGAAMEEARQIRCDLVRYFVGAMKTPENFPIMLSASLDETQFSDRRSTLYDYYAEYVHEYSGLYTERNPWQRRSDAKAGAVALQS